MMNQTDVNGIDVQRLFQRLKSRAGIKRARLLITEKPKVNAMTNMITHHIQLTTRDFQVLSLGDVKALLGHELGHLHDQRTVHYWIFNTFLFIFALLLSFINVDVTNPWLNVLIYFLQIAIDVGILMIPTSFYGRRGEARADRFSAKLVGAGNMIHLLEVIHTYHRQEIKQARSMTAKLKTVPTAYLECLALLWWHRALLWLNQHNLGIHPSVKKRIKLIKKAA